MKSSLLALALAVVSTLLAGCAATNNNDILRGASQVVRELAGPDVARSSAPSPTPKSVVDYMSFAEADKAVLYKLGGIHYAGAVADSAPGAVTFVEKTANGTRTYKVTIQGRQEIFVPPDALEARSVQLTALLKAVTEYSTARSKMEPTTVYARARTKADRDFLLAGLKPSAPARDLEIMSDVKPDLSPMLLLISAGNPTRSISK